MIKNSQTDVIASLRKSLNWMELVLATLHEAVLIVGKDMRIVFANDSAAELCNVSRMAMTRLQIWEALPLLKNDKYVGKNIYLKAKSKRNIQSLSGSYKLKKDEGIYDLDMAVETIPQSREIIFIIRDDTDRREAEKKRVALVSAHVARNEAEKRERNITIQYQVTRILSESTTYQKAIYETLKVVGQSLGWSFGALWTVHKYKDMMTLEECWQSSHLKISAFKKTTEKLDFYEGEDLPGRVWSTQKPLWVDDVMLDEEFTRITAARKTGLHAAFVFPIINNNQFFGAIEFYSKNFQQPDKEIMTIMSAIGIQIFQYYERKLAEEKLKRSERQYRLVVENSYDLVTLLDLEGVILYASPSSKKILGMQPNKLIGRNTLDFVFKDDIQLMQTEFKKMIRGKDSSYTYRYRNDAGNYITLEGVGSAIIDGNGKPYVILSTSRDITERIESEKRKDEFISMASHELKTPITSLKLYINILKQQIDRENKEALPTSFGKINDQITKLTRLVSELLSISKIKAGKLEFHEASFDISKLVKETVQQLQAASKKHKIVLKGSTRKKFYGDKDRIEQVLINIINNAIKYSPHANKVIVKVSSTRNWITIQVKDFGIGITKEDSVKIFDRFYQVSGNEEKTYPGLGIGLYISNEIIKKYKGNLTVKSVPKKGSTFTLQLPA